MYDWEALRKNSASVSEYLIKASKDTPIFRQNAEKYNLDLEALKRLEEYKNKVGVVVFSSDWCPDCQRHVPVLGLIAESIGMEIIVFGHLVRDLARPKGYWQIPPSPPEVKTFDVKKIPTIIVLDETGKKLGAIIENPPRGKTLENALLDVIESQSDP